jgi:dynein intermediate chain
VPIHATQTPSGRALNKLAWDRKDGRRAAVGSAGGSVFVYDVGEAAIPAEGEWHALQRTLAALAAAEREADGLLSLHDDDGGGR